MRKKITNTILLFLVIIQSLSAQNNGYIDAANFNPKEALYLHVNNPLLFTGEYLYYKVYCLNPINTTSSSLSKIAYVELINKKKQQVFKHKIKLNKGLGQGDFFIPTSIPTGNYKIIAYTEWMKNGGPNYFFKSDINIINPYVVSSTTVNNQENKSTITKSNLKTSSNYLNIELDNKTYSKRELVQVSLKGLKGTLGNGKYSISVRKIESGLQVPTSHAVDVKKHYQELENDSKPLNNLLHYPEINGSLIRGKVENKKVANLNKNISVGISIGGENFIYKTENTNENGEFTFSIKENDTQETGIIQVLNDNREDYKITLIPNTPVDISELSFSTIEIDSSNKKAILNRSIKNQIEHAYYAIKPDTIIASYPKQPFYKKYKTSHFVLEEYASFPTMRDVFLEIVEHVWTTNNKNGERIIYVRNLKDNNKNYLPAIFIDGIFIQDHQRLLDLSVSSVADITVVQGNIIFGEVTYQGSIIVKTTDGEYQAQITNDFELETKLFKSQPKKKYYFQSYQHESESQNRIPDFRTQLYWNPSFTINETETNFHFYTSDIEGQFEINIEGFTNSGQPISISEFIKVKN